MIEPAAIQVRFADLDVMGHVNNSVYLSYFEMARVHYFGKLLGYNWDWKTDGVLLVKNEVEYIKPILITDRPLVHVTTENIGTKSFTLSYKVMVNEQVYTTGKSTLVCFDGRTNQTVEIPEQMMSALEQMK